MDAKVEKLREWIAQSDNIVFFGGAGVSTESGTGFPQRGRAL